MAATVLWCRRDPAMKLICSNPGKSDTRNWKQRVLRIVRSLRDYFSPSSMPAERTSVLLIKPFGFALDFWFRISAFSLALLLLLNPLRAAALPFQPYTWKNVAIVAGGFMPGIEFNPARAGLAYIRADMGGAYRWDSDQKIWIPLLDWSGIADWNNYGIESLAVDPSDPNRVYLAAGTYTNEWSKGSRMLRSADQGRTWQSTDMPFKMGGNEPGRSMGERLAVDPNDGRILFFGSRHDGLWMSRDRAVTWSHVASFPIRQSPRGIGIGEILFDPRSAGPDSPTPVIYAGVEQGPSRIYRSTDGGETWSALGGQPRGLMPQHIVLASDGILFISYSNAPGPNDVTSGAVYRYDPTSNVWTDITPVHPTSDDKFGYSGLAVDAQHPQTVMVATLDRWGPVDDIFRSTDGGKSWKSVRDFSTLDPSASPFLYWGKPQPRFGWWIGSVEIDPFDSNHVLYVTGATVWGTDNITAMDSLSPATSRPVVQWTVAAHGIEQTAVNDLISPPTGPHLISALGDICGFRHDDLNVSPPGGMMSNPIFASTTALDESAQNPNLLVRVGFGDKDTGAYSTDLAQSWQPFAAYPKGARGGSVAISADGGTIVWAPDQSTAFRSTDMGKTWSGCRGLPDSLLVTSDPTESDVFYAAEQNGGRFFVSTDAGKTFRPRAMNLPHPVSRLRVLASPGDGAKTIFLPAEDFGLWFSRDRGAHFAQWPQIQQANAIGFGAPAPGHANRAIYLSGEIASTYGVFRSDDSGQSWLRINDDGHGYGWPHSITGDPRVFGRVYLGTNGRGIVYGDPAAAR
jgi:xyloglucan-specific exo-beta-1,4-glucanase